MLSASRGREITAGVGGAVVLVAFSILVAFGFGAIGSLMAAALRAPARRCKAVPAAVRDVLFVLDSLPRNLIRSLVSHRRHLQPRLVSVEGIRSLVISGWDGRALALGFGFALALAVISLGFAGAAIKNRLVRT